MDHGPSLLPRVFSFLIISHHNSSDIFWVAKVYNKILSEIIFMHRLCSAHVLLQCSPGTSFGNVKGTLG